MFSRKKSSFITDLPEEWIKIAQELLTTSYESQLSKNNQMFRVFGKLYKGEVLIIVGLLSNDKKSTSSTTYFVSMDIKENQDYLKSLDQLVNSAGIFFDTFFLDKNWNDYFDIWQKENLQKLEFFIKITKENIDLSIQANELLLNE